MCISVRLWRRAGLAGLTALALAACASTPKASEPAPAALTVARLTAKQVPPDMLDGNALRVLLCGTSAPMPDFRRAKSCTVVIAGGKAFVFDVGPESWKNLALWRFPAPRIEGVFLTHFHSDHIGELGEFNMQTWITGRAQRLKVYGPPGVEEVVGGFNAAYRLDKVYRNAHHGEEIAPIGLYEMDARPFSIGPMQVVKNSSGLSSFSPPPPVAERRYDAETVIYEEGGVRITAFEVEHEPVYPAVGYRIDFGGRSVVISGDTVAWPNVRENAKGVDLMVHESQNEKMRAGLEQAARAAGNRRGAKIMADIAAYHLDPVEAANLAKEAGARLLVFHHIGPAAPTSAAEQAFFSGVPEVLPPDRWIVGIDGLRIDLPIGSSDIVTSRMDDR